LGAVFPILDDSPKFGTAVVLTEGIRGEPGTGVRILGWIVRSTKYYFAWKNSEGASNIWYNDSEGFDEG
jgi:hypothetical protein